MREYLARAAAWISQGVNCLLLGGHHDQTVSARRMWLQRNPAAGLSYKIGIPKANLTRHDKLQRGQWDSGASNLAIRYWTRDGRAVAWQIQAQWFYRKGGAHFLRLNLGWKDSGNRDRLIHVMHINPFRTWSR